MKEITRTDWQALPVGSCWLFQGQIMRNGYGRMYVHGRHLYAHRYFWTVMRGSIPAKLTIDHLCRERACVNPQHLEVVTMRENLRRGDGWAGRHARATHCPQGHEYVEATTITRRGARECRTCHNDRRRGKP